MDAEVVRAFQRIGKSVLRDAYLMLLHVYPGGKTDRELRQVLGYAHAAQYRRRLHRL